MCKPILYYVVLLCFIFGVKSLSAQNTFLNVYGSAGIDEAGSLIIPANNGSYYIAGTKGDSTIILNLDSTGALLWQRSFKLTVVPDQIMDLELTSDNYIVACGMGWTTSTGTGPATDRRGFVFKYDPVSNQVIWVSIASTSSLSAFNNVQETMPGGNYIAGGVYNFPQDGCSFVLDKNTGNSTSTIHGYQMQNAENFIGSAIVNNAIYMTGRNTWGGGFAGMRPAITKMSLSGAQLWCRMYVYSVATTARLYGTGLVADDSVLVMSITGNFSGTAAVYEGGMAKIDTSGSIIFAKRYSVSGYTNIAIREIINLPDGYLLAGYTVDPTRNLLLFKVDKQGEVLWGKTYGGASNDDFLSNTRTEIIFHNGYIWFVGRSQSFGSGDYDIIVAKTDANGDISNICGAFTVNNITVTKTDITNLYDGTQTLIETQNPFTFSSGTCTPFASNLLSQNITIDLGPDTTLCPGETLLLDATTAGGTYLWQDGSINATYTVTTAGTYWVEVMYNGCPYHDTVVVNYGGPPALDIFRDTVVCGSGPVTLYANYDSTTTGFAWFNGSSIPFMTVDTSGYYWGQAINACGTTTDTATVVFVNGNNLNLGSDTTLCPGEILLLDATTSGATYQWQNASTNPTYTVSTDGTYWVQITVTNCSFGDTINVAYDTAPQVSISNDTTICPGDSVTLTASSNLGGVVWSNASTNSSITVNSAGTYWAEASNGCGIAHEEVTVSMVNLQGVYLGPDTTICSGDTIILNAAVAGASYLWQNSSTDSTYTVTGAGEYSVAVSLGNCSTSDTIHFTSSALPDIQVSGDTSICPGEAVVISASTSSVSDQIVWPDSSTGNNYTATDTGIYIIYAVNGCGTSTDSVTISTGDCADEDCYFLVPTAFTPNDDGLNDRFTILHNCPVDLFQLMVFNRWGEKVYSTSNIDLAWDGFYKGEKVDLAVFVWQIHYRFAGETEVRKLKGNVTVIR